jgi:hypothetical protein
MHRLAQDVTLAHLPEADRQQRTMQATELLRRLYPDQAWEPQWWPRCAQLLAHAQTVLESPRVHLAVKTAYGGHAKPFPLNYDGRPPKATRTPEGSMPLYITEARSFR